MCVRVNEGVRREERRKKGSKRESTTLCANIVYLWISEDKGCCWRCWAGFKEYSWERRYLILGLRSNLASGKAEVICQSFGENMDPGRGCSVWLLDRLKG